jgi:hypothetical protein
LGAVKKFCDKSKPDNTTTISFDQLIEILKKDMKSKNVMNSEE